LVEETKKLKVPIHLRDKSYNDNFGNEKEIPYKYPHDYPNHKVSQQYLPDEVKNETFYIRSVNDKQTSGSD
jgi:putative ATPase